MASTARNLKLAELSAKIFGNSFNPTGARTGNYILNQSFRGEHMIRYYPSKREERMSSAAIVSRYMKEKVFDVNEIDRLNVLDKRRARGKGAPKKGEGRRAALANKGKKR